MNAKRRDPSKAQKLGRIVVVDDDEAARDSLGQMLRLRRYDVTLFDNAPEALDWSGLADTDCIIADIKMPKMDGEEMLRLVRCRQPSTPVIMITGFGDVAMAVRCLKAGAYDFVVKPIDDELLLAAIGRAVERSQLHRRSQELTKKLNQVSDDESGRFGMIGTSPVMQDLYAQLEVVAKTRATCLIVGETGSGKELVARAIHEQSNRSKGPFIAVNAGALPQTMMESELFGHARGAFTGADRWRDGKIVASSGGTLLLDEVESISELAQRQLLRVLEDNLVYPLGRDKPLEVDVRLLATTKLDLRELVSQGKMREDFYHRLVIVTISVPPLRDRPEDIPLLLAHFLKAAACRNEVPICPVPEKTLGMLMAHSWPGNVRELRNTAERMLIASANGELGEVNLLEPSVAPRLVSIPATQGLLRTEMERTERTVIAETLAEHQGCITETAQALGISRRALYDRLKKYDLHRDEFLKS